jgi:hypothetical protein
MSLLCRMEDAASRYSMRRHWAGAWRGQLDLPVCNRGVVRADKGRAADDHRGRVHALGELLRARHRLEHARTVCVSYVIAAILAPVEYGEKVVGHLLSLLVEWRDCLMNVGYHTAHQCQYLFTHHAQINKEKAKA